MKFLATTTTTTALAATLLLLLSITVSAQTSMATRSYSAPIPAPTSWPNSARSSHARVPSIFTTVVSLVTRLASIPRALAAPVAPGRDWVGEQDGEKIVGGLAGYGGHVEQEEEEEEEEDGKSKDGFKSARIKNPKAYHPRWDVARSEKVVDISRRDEAVERSVAEGGRVLSVDDEVKKIMDEGRIWCCYHRGCLPCPGQPPLGPEEAIPRSIMVVRELVDGVDEGELVDHGVDRREAVQKLSGEPMEPVVKGVDYNNFGGRMM